MKKKGAKGPLTAVSPVVPSSERCSASVALPSVEAFLLAALLPALIRRSSQWPSELPDHPPFARQAKKRI